MGYVTLEAPRLKQPGPRPTLPSTLKGSRHCPRQVAVTRVAVIAAARALPPCRRVLVRIRRVWRVGLHKGVWCGSGVPCAAAAHAVAGAAARGPAPPVQPPAQCLSSPLNPAEPVEPAEPLKEPLEPLERVWPSPQPSPSVCGRLPRAKQVAVSTATQTLALNILNRASESAIA